MHCHCGTNNRAPRWTFTDPCKPEVRPGTREESASPAWLAAPVMNARDTTKVYIWRLDTPTSKNKYFDDDVKVAASSPLCAVVFFKQSSFACIRFYNWRPTVRIIEA